MQHHQATVARVLLATSERDAMARLEALDSQQAPVRYIVVDRWLLDPGGGLPALAGSAGRSPEAYVRAASASDARRRTAAANRTFAVQLYTSDGWGAEHWRLVYTSPATGRGPVKVFERVPPCPDSQST